MIEFRVVMPNRVTNPTKEPIDKFPPVKAAATIPPTRANGRFTSTKSVFRPLRNTIAISSTIPTLRTLARCSST